MRPVDTGLEQAEAVQIDKKGGHLQKRFEVATTAFLHDDVYAGTVFKRTNQLHRIAAQLQPAGS